MSTRFRDVMMEARIRRYVTDDPKPSLFSCWVRAFVGRITSALLPVQIATSPVKAASPVPSIIVPPRMTVSCIQAPSG
jgi:hypothetical protein